MIRPTRSFVTALIGLGACLAFVSPWLTVAVTLAVAVIRHWPSRHNAGVPPFAPFEEELKVELPTHSTYISMATEAAPADRQTAPAVREASALPPALEPSSAPHQLAALRSTLSTYVPALPVLTMQLQDAVRSAEGSVEQLCGRFQDIAGRARESISLALHQGSGSDDAGLEKLMRDAQHTLQELIPALSRDSARSRQALERILALQAGMQATLKIAREVEAFNDQVKFMSFNARLEAGRLGEAGRPFAVIASEITALAKNGAEMVASIQETVNRLNADCAATCVELEQLAEQTRRNQVDVTNALQTLGMGYEKMHRSIVLASDHSQALAQDISGVVMALQFQDATSQRIGHVVHALEEIHGSLSRAMEGDHAGHGADAHASLLTRMEQQYTMDAERHLLARFTGAGRSGSGARTGGDDNVELFGGGSVARAGGDDNVELFGGGGMGDNVELFGGGGMGDNVELFGGGMGDNVELFAAAAPMGPPTQVHLSPPGGDVERYQDNDLGDNVELF